MSDQIFDNKSLSEMPPSMTAPAPQPPTGWRSVLRDKKVIGSAIAALLLLSGIFWYFLSGSGTPADPASSNVVLLIKGPASLNSGNEAEYKIIYRNGEDGDLVNVSLEMIYPSNFKFVSAAPSAVSAGGGLFNLPLLRSGNDAEVVIRGKLTGATGETKELRAKLHYKLSNFNSEFAVEEKFATAILAPNLSLDVTGPVDVVIGQDTTFTVNYGNVSEQVFENMAVRAILPADYKFASATPPATKENNFWTLNKLIVGQTGKIDITGSFFGNHLDEELVTIEIGTVISNNFATLVTSSAAFRLTKPALSLTGSTNPAQVVELGDNIEFSFLYENTGSIGMTNVVIVATLEGSALNLSSLNVSDAVVTGNVLTWKSATLADLSVLTPSESGRISFNVPIKESVASSAVNQTVKVRAVIYSAEMTKPISAADMELKLASKIGLAISGEHVSGPMPMKVGEPTVLAVTMLVTNMSNNLENTEVIASMPLPASSWTGVIVPESEKARLTYDPQSGKIRWKIGALPAFTGKYTPALRATFHLSVTPSEGDRGKVMDLLRDVAASGFDSFIQQKIEAEQITNLPVGGLGDDYIDSRGATVQ